MIPTVVEGNFLVKKACGETPAILGKKLPQHFGNGSNYFEIVIDVTQSAMAGSLVKLMIGYAKRLVIDLSFLIEGQSEDELPEELIGGLRFSRIDLVTMDNLHNFYEHEGTPAEGGEGPTIQA